MALKTLSRQEFLQHPVGRKAIARGLKPAEAYGNYLSFVRTRRARRAAQPTDPLAPLSEPQLRTQVSQALRSQTDPLLAEITREEQGRTAAVDRATRGRMLGLSGYDDRAREIFGRAQTGAAKVGDALKSALYGSGAAAEQGLTKALEAINAPEALVTEVAGGAAGFAKGAANAGLAEQTGFLGELIGRGAEAENFASLLPGFAEQQGAMEQRDLRAGAAAERATLRGKIPGVTADLLSDARDRELQKLITRLGFSQDQSELQFDYDALTARTVADQAAAAEEATTKRTAARGEAIAARGDQLSASTKSAREFARELYRGEEVETVTGGKLVGKKTKTVKRPTWQQAYRAVFNEVAADLQRYGIKPGRIRQIVVQALRDAGFTGGVARSEAGQPLYGQGP